MSTVAEAAAAATTAAAAEAIEAAAAATTAQAPEAAAQQAGVPLIAPELRIVEWQNEWIVRGAHPFTYQAPDAMLAELRERYHLDEVIASGRAELEQMLLLREWVHTRWKHGWTRTPPARNALDILRAEEAGHDFNCGYFAVTLMQCLLAVGFVARDVSICKPATEWMAADEGNIGHSVVEAWSHQFHKWIVLDPDLNVHYEHGARRREARLMREHQFIPRSGDIPRPPLRQRARARGSRRRHPGGASGGRAPAQHGAARRGRDGAA